jgi:uncharacterized surface protein with fasciclin (FAS1) repeats
MMSIKNLYNGWKGMACCTVVAAMTLTACSDWDDHFDANTSVLESQHSSLWQNIEQAGNLSQFAALLKKTGFDENLSASQTFTVWAPVDDSFDYATLSNLSNERITREFIENHIARNNYPASGLVNEDIYMLNEKKMHFAGTSAYDIQGISLLNPNMSSSSNGTLHTIKGRLPFLSSIYEALGTSDYELDSISSYIFSFDEKKIDEKKSKKGPVTNGEQTYLDTVYYEHNDLFELYDSYINREDSSYTMVAPTNKAWDKAMATIKSYFKYVPQFEYYEDLIEKKLQTVKLEDATGMQDSVSKMAMIASLLYNNNIYDNKKLKNLQNGASLSCDSLVSTSSVKMYSEDATELFANTTRVENSNGAMWVTTDDTLHMRTWTIWNPEIRLEAEYTNSWTDPGLVYGSPEIKTVNKQNEEVQGSISNNRYIEVVPASKSVNPEIYFSLPNVRSTEYSVYVVFVPANINSKYYAEPLKKNHLEFTLGYADEKGKITEDVFKDIDPAVDSLQNVPGMTAKVDTTYVGDVTFKTSYVGMSSSSQTYAPYLRIRSRVSSKQTVTYDRTLRIDCIILRPKDLDNYIKAHPDYKYDRGLYN